MNEIWQLYFAFGTEYSLLRIRILVHCTPRTIVSELTSGIYFQLWYCLGVFWIFYLAEFWGFFFFLDGHVGGDGRRITEISKGCFPAFQAQTEAGAANQHTFEPRRFRSRERSAGMFIAILIFFF